MSTPNASPLPFPHAPDPLPIIRAALRERIEATSLRGTARAVGMSPTGLRELVEQGTSPYGPTRRRLLVWYARQGAATATDVDARAVGLELLTRGLAPAALRERWRAAVFQMMEDGSPELLERVESALRGDV